MSIHIFWLLQVAIHPGKLDEFRALARDLIAMAQSEPGTLAYEWNLSADQTTCDIYERFADDAAVLTHGEAFAAFAGRFVETCHPTSFHVFGAPSEAVKAAIADLHPVYFTPLGGFTR